MRPQPSRTLLRYPLLNQVGKVEMGEVFLAGDQKRGRPSREVA